MSILRCVFPLLFIFSIILSSHAQATFEPSLVILKVNETTYDSDLAKEIKQRNKQMKYNRPYMINEAKKAVKTMEIEAENFKIMLQKKVGFVSEQMDFYDQIPLFTEGFLQYKFFERFENLLIYAVPKRSAGALSEMAQIATENKVQYVLNFPKVYSTTKNGKKESLVTFQLYDHLQQKILLEKEVTGDALNSGFEFTCEDGGIDCTLNNALAVILQEVIYTVNSNNPTLNKEIDLAKERADILFEQILPQVTSRGIVDSIAKYDTSLSTNGFYQGLYSEDKTKFVGFFANYKRLGHLLDRKNPNDLNVKIYTPDSKDFRKAPRMYAYVIVGIQYQSKWYLKKDEITYFEAD
ncbi:MAG: hypothetical protein AAF242_17645, partial [Bacteroidota bacterium]